MAIRILTVEEAVEDTGIKILVYGPAGAGKTVLCATAGAPTLIISAEGGMRSLLKYAKESPHAFKNIRVVPITSIDDLEEVYSMLYNAVTTGDKEPLCDWIMLDSISEIAEQILSTAKRESRDPRQAYGIMQDRIAICARSFRDIPGYNVMFTAKMERKEDGDSGRVIYRPMLPGQRLPQEIPYWFDEVFALRVEIEKDEAGAEYPYRILQTDKDYRYDAKDRSGMLDQFEEANLAHIMSKMQQGYKSLEEDYQRLVSEMEKIAPSSAIESMTEYSETEEEEEEDAPLLKGREAEEEEAEEEAEEEEATATEDDEEAAEEAEEEDSDAENQ